MYTYMYMCVSTYIKVYILIYAKLTVRHCHGGLLNGSFSIGTIGNLLPRSILVRMCRAFTALVPDPTCCSSASVHP